MQSIDIHLISWNRPRMTELVIKAIHRNTDRQNFRLVVLDNASSDPTPGMLQMMYDDGLIDEYIPIKTNLGLEAARNLLLKNCTQSEYFVCVDNDCLPPERVDGEDWIVRLRDLIERYEDYGAISMRTQVMIGTGNIFEEADQTGSDIVDFPHPGGSYRIMKTGAAHFVGGWDKNTPGRGSEERHICAKLHEAGFRTAFAVKIQCLHLFGVRAYTKERWGYAEDLLPEDTGHSDISHPALTNGDDTAEVRKYAGQQLTERYFHD